MKHIKEIIYSREYFQKMGRKHWDDADEAGKEKRRKQLAEALKKRWDAEKEKSLDKLSPRV